MPLPIMAPFLIRPPFYIDFGGQRLIIWTSHAWNERVVEFTYYLHYFPFCIIHRFKLVRQSQIVKSANVQLLHSPYNKGPRPCHSHPLCIYQLVVSQTFCLTEYAHTGTLTRHHLSSACLVKQCVFSSKVQIIIYDCRFSRQHWILQ